MTTWRHLPPPARAIAVAITEAVDAAERAEADRFAAAVADLALLDPHQVGLVLGAVVRGLLEQAHPDGLDGDDVRAVLERCVRGSAWCPDVDPNVVAVLLVGSLGVHHLGDEAPQPTPAETARHAPLLAADLLTATRQPLEPHLEAAFAEIRRAETIEAP